MADNELYRQQDDLLHDVGNKYTKNWGSLLNFIGNLTFQMISILQRLTMQISWSTVWIKLGRTDSEAPKEISLEPLHQNNKLLQPLIQGHYLTPRSIMQLQRRCWIWVSILTALSIIQHFIKDSLLWYWKFLITTLFRGDQLMLRDKLRTIILSWGVEKLLLQSKLLNSKPGRINWWIEQPRSFIMIQNLKMK